MGTVSPIFQRILVASDLEEATIKTLYKWFPTYLREIERQTDLPQNYVQAPVYYTNRNKFDAQAGEKWPRVVVVAPGISGTPSMNGSGQYSALWRIGVGVACAARDEVEANMLVKAYGAAARAIIEQHQSLGGGLGIVESHWVDETYDDLPIPDQILLYKAAGVYFLVDVANVVNKSAGPTEVDPIDLEYGQVQDVIIDLQKAILGD